jgi:polyhydroxyalkanoate synthesis regulator protein
MMPNISQKNVIGDDITQLILHEIILLEEQDQKRGGQIIDIACFYCAAHVVSTDIWEKI